MTYAVINKNNYIVGYSYLPLSTNNDGHTTCAIPEGHSDLSSLIYDPSLNEGEGGVRTITEAEREARAIAQQRQEISAAASQARFLLSQGEKTDPTIDTYYNELSVAAAETVAQGGNGIHVFEIESTFRGLGEDPAYLATKVSFYRARSLAEKAAITGLEKCYLIAFDSGEKERIILISEFKERMDSLTKFITQNKSLSLDDFKEKIMDWNHSNGLGCLG